jgi:hypothetical protein
VGGDAPTAESVRVLLCERHLRLAPDHPVVLAASAWFDRQSGDDGDAAPRGTSLTRRRARKRAAITYFPK